jgi:uncharacterized protein (TIGR03435 family)
MKSSVASIRSRWWQFFVASAVAALVIMLAQSVSAQSEPLNFEVASVKPNNDPDFRSMQLQFLPGGRVVFKNAPLVMIIARAYDLPFQSPRLTAGTEWQAMMSKAYDIEASAGEGAIKPGLSTKERNDKIRLMLQSLLKERFKLNVRIEQKEQPAYALVVAKGEPKLEKARLQEKDCVEGPNRPSECHRIIGGQGQGIHGDAISIPDVVLYVQNWTDQPVVDRTGLKDLYNIQTKGWRPMIGQPPPEGTVLQGEAAALWDPTRQTLADVLGDLGLRMESQRAVIDMFVVDHVEQPSEN